MSSDSISHIDVSLIPSKQKSKRKIYMCPCCNKEYKRKKAFENHHFICRQLHDIELREARDKANSKYQKETVSHDEKQDIASLPSQMEMYKLLQVMVKKYESLQEEVDTMKQYFKRKQKKIQIDEWLERHCVPDETLHIWLSNIEVQREEVEYMFENGYISGILFILQNNLPPEDNDKHPLKCFHHKRNIFYKYDAGENAGNGGGGGNHQTNNQNNKWSMMKQSDFDNLIVHVNHYLMKEFISWRDEHKEKIDKSEAFYDTFMKNMRTILGGNKSKQENLMMIQSKLYQYLKCDLKAIYEFEF